MRLVVVQSIKKSQGAAVPWLEWQVEFALHFGLPAPPGLKLSKNAF